MRIVSLLPSCTEILCALNGRDQLVGRSHECDFPESVHDLPVCTAARVDSSAASAEIDRQIKHLLQNALSIYEVDLERLRQLRPDLILTQAQCEVCAVSLKDIEAALGAWSGTMPRLLSVAPKTLSDVWDDIRRVAEAASVPDGGKELIKALKARVVDIIEKTCVIRRRPAVACMEWLDPLMTAGNWVPELVELAGGKDVFGQPGKHSAWLDWAKLRDADPEVLVTMPCGFDLNRTRQEMPALVQRPGWNRLRAVKDKRVFIVDGSHYFNRPGPRLVESLEMLAEMFWPRQFSFGHRGRGWEILGSSS